MDDVLSGSSQASVIELLLRVVIQLALFCASAFFSGSETALFSLSRFDTQRLTRERSSAARLLLSLLEQPRRLIVSILCGNELANIAAAANMTALLVALLGVEAAAWSAMLIMIPLILLIGEVTPKTLAVSNPLWVSTQIIVKPISWWVQLIAPLAFFVRIVADRITTLIVGPERAKENILHIEDIQTLIEEGIESGEITATERALVHGLIAAGSAQVREIMTPRSQVTFIDASIGDVAVREAFIRLRRTRTPVFINEQDNVLGFLCVDDVITWKPSENSDSALLQMLQPPITVTPDKDVDEMLDLFAERGSTAALVVSDNGNIEGMITLADVTRFLFSSLAQAPQTHQEATA